MKNNSSPEKIECVYTDFVKPHEKRIARELDIPEEDFRNQNERLKRKILTLSNL